MADFLDEGFGQQQPDIQLDDFIQAPQQSTTIPPEGAVRNRAATTALLSGNPEEAVNNYRQMLLEAQQGMSTTQKMLQQDIDTKTDNLDTKTIMNILADSSVPFETKQQVVKGYKASFALRDNLTTLHTNLLARGSNGESKDQEEARVSTADAIAETQRARVEAQGIVNAHIASTENRNVGSALFDAIASVIPGVANYTTAKLAKQAAEVSGEKFSLWDFVKAGVDKGGTKLKLRNKIEAMNPQERVDFTKKLVDAIGANSSIIFGNENQYVKFQQMDEIWLSGYSDKEAAMDTISTILDVVGLGWGGKTNTAAKAASGKAARAGTAEEAAYGGTRATPGRKPAPDVSDVDFEEVHRADWTLVEDKLPPSAQLPNPQKKLPYEDKTKRIEMNSPVHQSNPASPGEIANQSNPQQARAINDIVVQSESDEAAKAFYGTSRQQAVVNNTFPQAATESGAVASKPFDIQKNLRKPVASDELVDMVHNTGATYFTPGEKAAAKANVVNDFSNATGMTMNENMSSFTVDGGRVFADAVYGANDGSWSTAKEAIEQAKFALRHYGVADEDITLLKKQGIDHVPVSLEEAGDLPGDYLIRVRTPYEFSADDIGNFDKLTTRFNWFDRAPALVSSRKSSLSRYIFDASSMLDTKITTPATVATDAVSRAEKTMLSYAANYTDQYVKLGDLAKAKIDDYIREANLNGIPYDQADLIARGFGPDEISAIKAWRDFWDGHFYLENYDVVRSLKNKGFQVFQNSKDTFFAKPIQKNINKAKVYDPSSDMVLTLSKDALDDLYNKGGTVAAFRRPVDFNGEVAEHIMVRNTPTEYLRGLRDSDQVLNYRQGYYQVQYTAPKFVDEVIRDSAGNVTKKRTVAVAGDTKEAQLFADRQAKNTGGEYSVRDDYRAISRDSDEYWDIQQASGRIAQRHRGKLLEDASAPNQLGDNSYVMHPVESATKAAKSIAGRTMTRQMLDTAKARILDQFAEAFPSNGMGGRKWPSNIADVGQPGAMTSKFSGDARTNWEYVNYLENGYLNSIDEAFKMGMRAIATTAGEKGLSSVERAALGLATKNVSGLNKGIVFNAYIASNPLRQFIVQPHQVMRTWVYNPVGWAKGSVERYATAYLAHKGGMGGSWINASDKEFIKFVDEWGALEGVDQNNLVRGTLREAANSSNRVVRAANKPLEKMQEYGFDIAEQANLLGHAAAVYDRYLRLGRNLSDKAVRDEAFSEARALSYDMNFAGDMPYNQTSPSVALQFLQIPIKAALQITNRRIPLNDRIKLTLFDLFMWGTPIATVSSFLGGDILPDDEPTRKFLMEGAESVLINKMFTDLTKEETDIDFSSLAPYNMDGWGKIFAKVSTEGIYGVVMASPSGQLWLKDGGRVQNALGSMSRWFNGHFEKQTRPETFLTMMNEVAKISSGWNNGVKAAVLLQGHKVLDQYGNAIDPSVSTAEAWAAAFGFGTADTREYYALSQEWSKDIKKQKKDVEGVVDDIFRYYKNQLNSENTDTEFVQGVVGMALMAFKDDPQAQALASAAIRQRLRTEDSNLVYLMMKRSGIPDATSMKDGIRRAPVDEETRKMMEQRYNDAQNAVLDYQKANKE